MALIKCRECGNLISDKASRCPKCGCPVDIGDETRYRANVNRQPMSQQPVYYDEGNSENGNKWLYGIIALLLAARRWRLLFQ